MMADLSEAHEHPVRVRYAECDAMGYLHHARYFEHIEEARTAALRDRGFRYRDLEADGVFFVVVKLACRYHQPIRYDDLITIHTSIERFTRTRVDHAYQILRDGELMADANTTLACVNRTGRPTSMPDRIWSTHQTTKPRRRDR